MNERNEPNDKHLVKQLFPFQNDEDRFKEEYLCVPTDEEIEK